MNRHDDPFALLAKAFFALRARDSHHLNNLEQYQVSLQFYERVLELYLAYRKLRHHREKAGKSETADERRLHGRLMEHLDLEQEMQELRQEGRSVRLLKTDDGFKLVKDGVVVFDIPPTQEEAFERQPSTAAKPGIVNPATGGMIQLPTDRLRRKEATK